MDDITAQQTLSEEGYIDYLISKLLSNGDDLEDCTGDCHLSGDEKNNRRRTLKFPYFECDNREHIVVEICGLQNGKHYVSKECTADFVYLLFCGRMFRISQKKLRLLRDKYLQRARIVSLKNIDRFVVPIPRQVLLDNSLQAL